MPLQIIGAGLPRSGTASLHAALEQLGYRTHHMQSVMASDELSQTWCKIVVDGHQPDWHAVFANFDAALDNPSFSYWEQQLAAFPDAKVVLSVRPPRAWANSFHRHQAVAVRVIEYGLRLLVCIGARKFETVLRLGAGMKLRVLECCSEHSPPCHASFTRMPDRPSKIPLPSPAALEVLGEKWLAAVKERCPADRLLVFDVRDGWEPLCKFLDVPTPDTPFPHTNAGARGPIVHVFVKGVLQRFTTLVRSLLGVPPTAA